MPEPPNGLPSEPILNGYEARVAALLTDPKNYDTAWSWIWELPPGPLRSALVRGYQERMRARPTV
jgi:hypothetical protein